MKRLLILGVIVLVAVPGGVFVWVKSADQPPVIPVSIRTELIKWKAEHLGYRCRIERRIQYAVAFSCTHTNGNEADVAFVTFFTPDAPASLRAAASGGN